ncbi:MAG: LCP family protein, partial [Butyrivibrio sp.]|nr:LCP family protein [Butyrivibrio sp.]
FQLFFSFVAIGVVASLNLLPAIYLFIILLVLVLLWTLVYFFLFSGSGKSRKGWLYAKRSIGGVLSAAVMIVCMVVSIMAAQAGSAIRSISDYASMTDVVSAYVLKDDAAQTLQDAKDYTFGITEKYDYERTEKTIKEIEQATGTAIKTQNYENFSEMAKALYNKEVDSVILNAAYVQLIEMEEEFESFSQETRTLFDHEQETILGTESTQKDEHSITTDPFLVYISGSDSRQTGFAGGRSDVNILVVVNPTTKQVLLINTPRDYYVVTAASSYGEKDKLTHCGVYGIDCSMETLGLLYDEPVEYYVQINFSGFETLVDAIGGITIDSERAFRTSEGGYYISQGTNQLNGAVALSYVRERKAFADGDNTRGKNQMAVIEAIISKLSSDTSILSNYSGIMDSMSGMFATNMGSGDISSLVKMQLSDMASWNVKSYAVTGTGGKTTTYSMPDKRSYVMYPDEEQVMYATELVNRIVAGEILTDADLEMPQTQTEEAW